MPRAAALAVVSLALLFAAPAHASRTVALDAGDAVHAFVVGSDGALYHAPPGGVLERLGGTGLAEEAVAVVRSADGRLAVFARGEDDSLYESMETTPGGTWSAWIPIGTDVVGSPDALLRSDNRLEVFARGSNGELWHAAQTLPGGAFGPFESLGGALAGDPSAVLDSAGAVAVFARGTDDALRQYGASGWSSLGGKFTGDPAAARNANGTLDPYARGADGSLFGTAIAGRPAAVLDGLGRLELFARGADGALMETIQTVSGGAFGPWRSLGGSFIGDPAAVRDGASIVHVVIGGAANELFATEQIPFDRTQFRPFTSLGSAKPPPPVIFQAPPPVVTPPARVQAASIVRRTVFFGLVFKTNKPGKASTTFRSLNATDVPAGATVTATCAKGCARKRVVVQHAFGKVPLKPLIASALAAGTKIRVEVTVPGMVGAQKTLTVRAKRKPSVK